MSILPPRSLQIDSENVQSQYVIPSMDHDLFKPNLTILS